MIPSKLQPEDEVRVMSPAVSLGFIPDEQRSLAINAFHFDRELQSLIHQPGFDSVRGMVFGKFQRASNVDLDTLTAIVESKRELKELPIVAEASFGHTTPQFTFPIGGRGRMHAGDGCVELWLDEH